MAWAGMDFTEYERLRSTSDKEVQTMVEQAQAALKLFTEGNDSFMSAKESKATIRYFASCILSLASTLNTIVEVIERMALTDHGRD